MTFLVFIGSVLLIVLGIYGIMFLTKVNTLSTPAPTMSGQSAMLPCLANNHCPMGQACAGGFCGEGFMAPMMPSSDMSSCNTKECKGINATCSRKDSPCPEGTFCQQDACVNITAQDNGEAYKQIGMLLD
jgi:hypothetical protein